MPSVLGDLILHFHVLCCLGLANIKDVSFEIGANSLELDLVSWPLGHARCRSGYVALSAATTSSSPAVPGPRSSAGGAGPTVACFIRILAGPDSSESLALFASLLVVSIVNVLSLQNNTR